MLARPPYGSNLRSTAGSMHLSSLYNETGHYKVAETNAQAVASMVESSTASGRSMRPPWRDDS